MKLNKTDTFLLQLIGQLDPRLCFVAFLNAKLQEARPTTQERLSRLFYQGLLDKKKGKRNKTYYNLSREGSDTVKALQEVIPQMRED